VGGRNGRLIFKRFTQCLLLGRFDKCNYAQ
jgi:hypothetical protein